jgi:hypothetical protein
MAVSVAPKRSQSRSRRLALPSLLGDGMPERLRSTSIALIGAVAAIGLSTVAFALQLGLPSVVSGPLPEPPAKPRAVTERHRVERKVAAEPRPERLAMRAAPATNAENPSPASDPSPSVPGGHKPSGGAVLVTRPPQVRSRPARSTPPEPAPAQSPSPETPSTPAPPVEPGAAASEVPPPEPAPETPAPTHPGNGNAYGKGNGNGVGAGGEPPGQVAKAASQAEAGK